MSRLKKRYTQEIIPQLLKEFNLKNTFQAPQMTKVVVNVGITEDQHQKESLKNMAEQLAIITGQQPKTTRARQSIASFKLRQGDPIGLAVTMRGTRMYQFVDKLIATVLPRVKDFQGIDRQAFDQDGNYSLGLEEQIVFPEIEYDKIDRVRGLQINIVIKNSQPNKSLRLMELLGFPFKKVTE